MKIANRPSPLRFILIGLVVTALCQPLGLSAEEPAESTKAPASDKTPVERVWYWVRSVDIPENNPIHKVDWDKTGPPDLLVVVERNGVKLGQTEVKEDCWKCVYEKKYVNTFPFRNDKGETYTITIFDHDWPDPDDSMLQIVVPGDTFNAAKDGAEVVVREKPEVFAAKESLVTVTFVRISDDEALKLKKAAGN